MLTSAIRMRIHQTIRQTLLRKHNMPEKLSCVTFSEQPYLQSLNNSNSNCSYNVVIKPIDLGSEQEKQEFASSFPVVLEDLVNASTDTLNFKKRYTNLLYENVGKDREELGNLAATAYKMFANPEDQISQNIKLANILGWCANLLVASKLIFDDVIHSSKTCNGKPCWYENPDVGMNALNEATVMACGPYLILQKYFSGLPCYISLIEWFRCVSSKVVVGRTLDHLCMVDGRPRLESFTMENYRRIVKHNTTYPTFLLPVVSGIHLANKYNDELFQQADDIFFRLGLFLFAQNDVLNCYGDPAITGRDNNDIHRGKCTWLAVKAVEEATSAQKQILIDHYGKPDDESENKVQTLFAELRLLDKFLSYRKNSFNSILQIIDQVPKHFNREFFRKVVNAAYEQSE